MKLLPQSDNTDWQEEIGELELAQLHCLRSIAVSLECLAKTLSCEFAPSAGDHKYWIKRLNAHSVREVPGD